LSTESLLDVIRDQVQSELTTHIIPYWTTNVFNPLTGKFYARIDGNNKVDALADHVCILHARILWFFSSSFRVLQNESLKPFAQSAYNFLSTTLWDETNGGVYWSVDANEQLKNTKKHAYGQAFAIYAFAEYARAFNDEQALEKAKIIFNKLENYSFDANSNSYIECFDRNWNPLNDVRLGDSDIQAARSFNTHLHILEAFTTLYRVWPDNLLKKRLNGLIDLHLNKIWSDELNHFNGFFNEDWQAISTAYSYGHDIEASWLLTEAAKVTSDVMRMAKTNSLAVLIASKTLEEGLDKQFGGIFNSGQFGKVLDSDKHWWAQAEAIVGLVNEYQISGNTENLEYAVDIWKFINEFILDAMNGEWFWKVDFKGNPSFIEDKIGPWKCPYHTGRLCLEMMERVKERIPVSISSK
jgi:cellobiose epimerase